MIIGLAIGIVVGVVASAAVVFEALSDEWDPHDGWSGVKQRLTCRTLGHGEDYPNPDKRICSRCGSDR